jgi:hypothetical protein
METVLFSAQPPNVISRDPVPSLPPPLLYHLGTGVFVPSRTPSNISAASLEGRESPDNSVPNSPNVKRGANRKGANKQQGRKSGGRKPSREAAGERRYVV